MAELILYHTEFCHLCEEAESIMLQAGLNARYRKVDIDDDENLLKQYGVRIPVIKRLDTGRELSWPFDLNGLSAFLRETN